MKRNRLLLLAGLLTAVPVWSQTDSAAPAPAPATPAAATTVAMNEKKDLISVDFPIEDIRTIVRNVAELF